MSEDDLHKAGWRLVVAQDGASVTVHAPDTAVITAMSSRSVTIALANESSTGLGAASGAVPNTEDKPTANGAGPEWSVELIEQILRRAQPTASTFLRELVNHGGTATAEHLHAATGLALRHVRQSLTSAAAAVLSERYSDGRHWRHHLAEARYHPDDGRGTGRGVQNYHLPDHLVPLVDQALRNLGR